MQFKPIIDAVEAQIKADGTANPLIAIYNRYTVLPGVHSVPLCVTGTTLSAKVDEEYLGVTGISSPRLWAVIIGISLLTRNYPQQSQVIRSREGIDAAQHAVYHALNKDCTFGGIVVQSWTDSVREVALLNGEYRGFEVLVQIQVFESSD